MEGKEKGSSSPIPIRSPLERLRSSAGEDSFSPLDFEIDTERRVVFVSGPFLSQQFQQVPEKVLKRSLFVFPCKRSWIFPENAEETEEASVKAPGYLSLDEAFKAVVKEKEERGYVHYLHGEDSFGKLSDFLVRIRDPCSGGRYEPLQLEEQWWMENFIGGDYASGPSAVVSNIQAAGEEVDVSALMELLYQSNTTLLPVLVWDEAVLAVL